MFVTNGSTIKDHGPFDQNLDVWLAADQAADNLFKVDNSTAPSNLHLDLIVPAESQQTLQCFFDLVAITCPIFCLLLVLCNRS